MEVTGLETKSSGFAVLLSFLCPGLGHIYLGAILRGLGMMALMTILLLAAFIGHEQAEGYVKMYQALLYAQSLRGDYTHIPKLDPALEREWHEFQFLFLGALIAALAWWVWSMIAARRLCDRINEATYLRAATGRTIGSTP